MCSELRSERVCVSCRSCNWSQWSQDCWDCAWRYTQCSVAFLYHKNVREFHVQDVLYLHKFHKQARVWLQPGQRQKQNLNRENLLGRQQPYQHTKEDGLTLNHQNTRSWLVRKKVINLLRHNQTLKREEDGAIEFWKIKFHLRNHHSQIQNWSDDRWKACLAAGGGSKRRYQYCSDNLGTIIYLRSLQEHSGSNLIDPTLQDNVLIGTGIFPYIYHVGCTFNLQSKFEQKINGVLLACSSKRWKSQRPWIYWLLCTTSRSIHPQSMEETPRRGILDRYWSWNQGRISVPSNKIERNYSSRNTSSKLHCKSWKIEKWRKNCMKNNTCLLVHHRRSLWGTITIGLKGMIRVLQLNISQLGNSFNSHLGEALQAGSSKPTQFPTPIEDRTRKPVTQEIVGKSQGEPHWRSNEETRYPRDCW